MYLSPINYKILTTKSKSITAYNYVCLLVYCRRLLVATVGNTLTFTVWFVLGNTLRYRINALSS